MRWRALAFLLLTCGLLMPAAAHADPRDSNSQIWTELDIDAPVTDRLSLTGLAALRAGDGLPNPTVVAAGAALNYAIGRHWTLSAGDYWIQARSASSGKPSDLQLPVVALTYAGHLGRFSFSDRNRGERVTGVPGGDWRYRNRLSVSHPLLIGPVRSVTASDEVFYDGARDRWSRNRAQLGVGLAPLGRLSMQIYILRQDDRFSKPGHLNVLGLALGLKLGRRH